MISNKSRESRRGKLMKMPKNIQRLYKEGKCSECSVIVTRMDFAKILGKFTKVKIQYESTAPKVKKTTQGISPNSRLKSNENGMVLLHRNAYNQHPVKILNKAKANDTSYVNNKHKENSKVKSVSTPNQQNNILKENNRLKRPTILKKTYSNLNNNKIDANSIPKQYGIIFVNPDTINNNDVQNGLSLTDLLSYINKDMLPSEEWCIDYFPKDDEPKDDKVYDRIAAELEDLMYNEKEPPAKSKVAGNKSDDFPSILDILNDNTTGNIPNENNQSNTTDFKSNLESSDVEAMLLGKSNENKKESETTPMEVDNSVMSSLIANVVLNQDKPQGTSETDEIDNPHSPSILDETLQKGIEEQLPNDQVQKEKCVLKPEDTSADIKTMELDVRKNTNSETKVDIEYSQKKITITHVVFKKSVNGKCYKSVTCPKNLKYSIELEGKSVEFLGAPKYISSLEDLQVLLQIVDESHLDSLYVLH